MVYGHIFATILKVGVTISLSVLLLESSFITSSWGMDPPPEKKGTGAKSKFTNLKGKFTSSKSKPKDEVKEKLTPAPQADPGTPSRSRANTVVQSEFFSKPESRPRSNSLIPSGSKSRSNSLVPPKKNKSPSSAFPEPTYEKLITSDEHLNKAFQDQGLSQPDNYTSLKIVTSLNAPLNQKKIIPFEGLFQKYARITTLSISGLTLGATATGDLRMQTMVNALKSMQLEKLSLVNCDINEIGMKRLASILFRPAHADSCTRYLADILTELNISSNKIGDMGAAAIKKALEKNSTLTKLYLGTNQIGDIGAQSMGMLLISNKTLKDVHLTDNEITGTGIGALLSSLQQRTRFTLHLQGNMLEREVHYELLVLEDSLPTSLCLIKNNQLGLIVEENQLYCKVHNQAKLKIPDPLHSTQGLPLETLNSIISIIQKYLVDGNFTNALEGLNQYKKKILRFTSGIGYTPLINGLQNYKDLLSPFVANNVHVYLPEVPPPYVARHQDESE